MTTNVPSPLPTGGAASIPPADVWSLVISSAARWAQVSITEVANDAAAESVHGRRREALAALLRDGLAAAAGTR